MATTNKVKGWIGVLMTEDSSSHWPIKRRYVYYETSRRAGLEFVCIFGHDALAADPDVDAVYVSTPHPFHKDNSILLLEQGKAVLCEKPFTMNAEQAQTVIGVARKQGMFLMEAMWTRYIPAVVRARELIAEGAIGDVRMVQADFGFRASMNPESRLFNKALGGGALLDVGIYVLFWEEPTEFRRPLMALCSSIHDLLFADHR